jgi:hypothetical protein
MPIIDSCALIRVGDWIIKVAGGSKHTGSSNHWMCILIVAGGTLAILGLRRKKNWEETVRWFVVFLRPDEVGN